MPAQFAAKRSALALSISAAIASGSVFALEPASLTEEGAEVVPALNVDMGYNDNVTLVDTSETGSMFTVIAPTLTIGAEREDRQYEAVYTITQTNYLNSSADNTTAHDLNGRAYMEFSTRTRLDLRAGYQVAFEGRDSGLAGATPTKFNESSASAAYEYGGKEATGRVRVAAGLTDREYQNNGAQTNDYQRSDLSTTFYYRVAPKTALLAEWSREETNYDLSTSTSDSVETEYLLGAEWEATAKTTGTLKLGWAEKDFDSAARSDSDGFTWKAGVRWEPKTYSVVELSTSREENESDGTGDFISDTDTVAQWTHGWTDKLSSRVLVARGVADYKGTTASDRKDTTTSFGLGADFDYQRWLNFSADYTRTKRSSSGANSVAGYTNNIIMFRVTASF